MATTILAATTSAATSTQFGVNHKVTKTVMATGLAGAEYVDLQIKDGSGAWVNSSTANRLTATDPVRGISSEGNYRLSKSVTVSPVSCSVSGVA